MGDRAPQIACTRLPLPLFHARNRLFYESKKNMESDIWTNSLEVQRNEKARNPTHNPTLIMDLISSKIAPTFRLSTSFPNTRNIVSATDLSRQMWPFKSNGKSGFSSSSSAEEVTSGIDGSGLTAIVTGASSGIGAETARVLALRGVHVVMAVRNVSNGNKVKEAIVNEIPSAKVEAMELDLSSNESVREFVSEFTSSGRPLNILINNGGVMGIPFELSKDNVELQFATNYLGHFLLTTLLLDTIKRTASETKREGRIVSVSSVVHWVTYGEGIRFERLNDEEGYNRWLSYGQSKLATHLHTIELARRLKEDGTEVTVNSLHPGVVGTNIYRYFGIWGGNLGQSGGILKYLIGLVFKRVPQGASTSCYLALRPEVKGTSGAYFANNHISTPAAQALDTNMAKKLWDFSMDLVK
ncbi:short-chain dehydrogenase TIC 32, chloroplastic [Dorcoceras hygrometricum]|uniref:Short-chain dehydrogenase TIC 32, chloroplastic n=1 Tax=Dorcoceras hygrometricum TaxID=472368 RepID=A0A2Z7BW53_9LAMI|nr:short-chain dehydrogenase TIC 32, chloroplastic [Dorcoceras hygrometricum]